MGSWLRRCKRYGSHILPILPMLYAPFPIANTCRQAPLRRRKANRVALLLFTATAAAGLLLKYLAVL